MNGFLGSTLLDAAIGVAFIYFLLAIFCTAVNEWIGALLSARAGTLRGALLQLLGSQTLTTGESLADAFYAHPLIASLRHDDQHPSYLQPRAFSLALLDLAVTVAQNPALTFTSVETGIRSLPEGPVRTALLTLARHAQQDLPRLQTGIENWFNDAMHHASTRYRRRTQAWTLSIAAVITIASNADTLSIVQRLRAIPRLHGDTLVFGWSLSSLHVGPCAWLARIVGWLLTIGAVSLGAPFWFDVLNRFTGLRTSAPKPSNVTKQPQ